ncbi:MAG: hypothetical protein JOZ62_18290 [Acidobacteriaceae bacterium]|nr:hypothetical protein [Acidobacteriaceae bacterium]
MRCLSKLPWLVPVLLATASANASDRIGDIEFFGYKGLDIQKLRAAVPVHGGDEYLETAADQVRQAVTETIGKPPTDVAVICCDERHNRLLFIGVPGDTYKPFVYNPEPRGDDRLPREIMDLYDRLGPALEAAVRKGGDAPREDDSKGYSLINDPAARSLELAVHEWAVQHTDELMRVLRLSSWAADRRVASDALGYARQSRQQILALVAAAPDPDSEVRNNATRALGVLVRSNTALGFEIPPDTFIEMLNSGLWTDRNKSAMLLMELTATRNPDLLARTRSGALDSLIEMAEWRRPAHAAAARLVLGRVAGIPGERLKELVWNGPVEAIVAAARQR